MNKPKISIVTAVFNREEKLKKMLESVRRQSSKDWELIVIDGNSTDGTIDVIKENKDIISDWVSEKDTGIYNAMNKGAKRANGEYLYFLNSDDYFYNEHVIQTVLEELENQDLIYGNIEVFDEESGKEKIYNKRLSNFNLKLGYKVSQQAVFIKKDVFNKIKGLNEKYKIAADYDLLCKVFKESDRIKKIDTIIVRYQWGGASSDLTVTYKDTLSVVYDEYGSFYAFIYYILSSIKKIGRWLLSFIGIKF